MASYLDPSRSALSMAELQHRHRRTKKGTISNKRQSAKKNARRKGLSFSLTTKFLTELWDKQKGKCALSGVPMGFIGSGWAAASIDRIDPCKGYDCDNVQWVCWRVNDSKSTMKDLDFVVMCRAVSSNNPE